MTDTVAAARPQALASGAEASAEELLKRAVSGQSEAGSVKAPPDALIEPKPVDALQHKVLLGAKVSAAKISAAKVSGIRLRSLVDLRAAAVGGVALSLGLVIGAAGTAGMMPRGDANAALLSHLKTDLDAGRAETARVAGDVGRLTGTIVKSGERAAEDAKGIRTDLTQRMARLEQTLAAKVAALADKQDAADREQSARFSSLGTLIEKRTATQVAAPGPVQPQAAKPMSPDPVQTGSVPDSKTADVKPKPAAVSNWAVRDVYDGVAVLEDRKRRLVEVARGDTIPGIGRAEAIERRGRTWVVVTREGLITPQEW